MKRAMFGKAAVALLTGVAIAGCSPQAPEAPDRTGASVAAAGWTRPPMIGSVRRVAGGLVFSGRAEPGTRVVLRSESGPAHAAMADDEGRFEIRVTAPSGDLFLQPETQVGQDAAPAPERLLIVAGGQGPVVILRAGVATRRLDPAPALGAVDSDGRMRLVSGSSAPSGVPILLQAGGESGRVTPDAVGRWSLVLASAAGPDEIRVGGQAFIWPGDGAVGTGTGTRVERAGAGWRVRWSGPGGGPQTTWLPDVR